MNGDASIDRHFGAFMAERAGLAGERRQRFRQIVEALLAAMRDGSICIELSEQQRREASCSRMVAADGSMPLVLDGNRLYLARYHRYESSLAARLKRLASVTRPHDDLEASLDRYFSSPAGHSDRQRDAARVALSRGLCIISGGPGTGKTTTVVRIVALLLECCGTDLSIALAAPTGKAAMRLREAIDTQLAGMSLAADLAAAFPRETTTLHRLLGASRYSPRFKHNRDNPLDRDVVLVDEASMVDLALMSKLLAALKEGARLILLGDRDQLASVESGAVLNDCLRALPRNTVELEHSYRFDSLFAEFARLVKDGDEASWIRLSEAPRSASATRRTEEWLDEAVDRYADYMKAVREAEGPESYRDLFDRFHAFRVLCALKHGPRGVEQVNERIERALSVRGFFCGPGFWYSGRPVLVTRNDYNLDLYNGDIGLCLPDPDLGGGQSVWFEQPDRTFRRYLPMRLPASQTVWAMTVHKSQGSEFDEVVLLLPDRDNRVLCRELLYTGITRARKQVMIVADEQVWRTAVVRRTVRVSGLAEQLGRPEITEEGV